MADALLCSEQKIIPMRYTAEERQSKLTMITQWKESKLTQKEFCRKHKIPFSTFYYWHGIVQGKPKYKTKKKTSLFLQLPEASVPQGFNKQIELIFPKGHRLIFYYPMELAQLRQLMR